MELIRWYHLTKKVAKYVDNNHMKLSYELGIQKFGQIRQQGAMLTLSHFYSDMTMLVSHCRPNLIISDNNISAILSSDKDIVMWGITL